MFGGMMAFLRRRDLEAAMIQESIDLLGLKAKDKVSGMEGTITCVSFDLYGCVVAALSPQINKEGKVEDSKWYDIQRLDVTEERVMAVPHFVAMARKPQEYSHGAADKPAPRG